MVNFEKSPQIFLPENKTTQPILPPELVQHVSIKRLQENIKNHPEMSRELTELQKERIKKNKKGTNGNTTYPCYIK